MGEGGRTAWRLPRTGDLAGTVGGELQSGWVVEGLARQRRAVRLPPGRVVPVDYSADRIARSPYAGIAWSLNSGTPWLRVALAA